MWEWVKSDKNDRQFFKLVEITVGKGEFAHCEQFLFFTTVFSKVLFSRQVKIRTCFGNGLNTPLHTIQSL